jgi:predicted ArsR family transcriptional regulator
MSNAPIEPSGLADQLARLAALDDPVRRALYFYTAYRQRDVSRDEAAQAVGVSRNLAGFHLDRLVAEGLLEASFRRLSGRTGPGAGRPAKLYHRAEHQLEVSLPQRKYELAARLLAAAVDAAETPPREALAAVARETGLRIGSEARARAGPRAGRRRLLASLVATLADEGYEPEIVDGELRLRNCPFHALVAEHTQLVCGMNLSLLEGVVAGLEAPWTRPLLAPRPGHCCVTLLLDGGGEGG